MPASPGAYFASCRASGRSRTRPSSTSAIFALASFIAHSSDISTTDISHRHDVLFRLSTQPLIRLIAVASVPPPPHTLLVRLLGSSVVKVPFASVPCQSFNTKLYCPQSTTRDSESRGSLMKTTRKSWVPAYEGINNGRKTKRMATRIASVVVGNSSLC
ncbi:hypothetical protein K456DRAFT_142195 [Colletotrichum gloeosporioides 23]|nr:hypothetical protein K456DRAFT_142195 [Colletotrichum gloeosporioides 23]